MKILTPYSHVFFDYIIVFVFVLVPLLLGWSGLAATAAYIFAGFHLFFTLVTDTPLTPIKWIPLFVHGQYEFIISGVLIILTWPLGLESDLIKRNFYVIMGVIFFLIWLLTDYANNSTADLKTN